MSVRIDENTDHMKYTDDMEAIDSDIMDRVIAEMNSYDADIYTAKDVITTDRETRTSKTGEHGTTERTATGQIRTDAGQTWLPAHRRE